MEDWIRRALNHYRELAARETPETMEEVRGWLDLQAPCQIFGFTVADPLWQGFTVLRLPRIDERIQVKENVARWKMHETLAEVFLDPFWDEPLPDAPTWRFLSLREVGFAALDQLHNSQRSSMHIDVTRQPRSFIQRAPVSDICHNFEHLGDLGGASPETWVEEAFREGTANFQRKQEALARPPPTTAPAEPSRENPYKAHGAFHARHIRIGQITSKTLGDWYWADREYPGIITYRGTLGPLPFTATHNGFLCVETPDKTEANRWLNFVMTGFLSEGLPAVVVRAQDMASVHLPVGDDMVWGGTYPGTPRRQASFLDQRRITSDELATVLRQAEHHASQWYANQLPSLLEAHTHFEGNEPTQSFVFSWSIIEKTFARKWASYLDEAGASRVRREKLEGTDWTLDHRAETLQLAGRISKELYDRLTTIRRIRNRIFHGNEVATPEHAEQALTLANDLLSEGRALLRAPRKKSAEELWLEEYL